MVSTSRVFLSLTGTEEAEGFRAQIQMCRETIDSMFGDYVHKIDNTNNAAKLHWWHVAAVPSPQLACTSASIGPRPQGRKPALWKAGCLRHQRRSWQWQREHAQFYTDSYVGIAACADLLFVAKELFKRD